MSRVVSDLTVVTAAFTFVPALASVAVTLARPAT